MPTLLERTSDFLDEMSLYIYNSLTRQKEEFIPLNPPQVKIYTCGVTVYDQSHLGHARSLYIFDVIRRYLEYRKFAVTFVRNITDIDDKIINRANELKIDWKDLVKKYIDTYYEDLELLGIQGAIPEPRATENIPEMIKCIKDLIDKGYAYITDTGVYFSVAKFKDYGKLSGQSIKQMLSGVRKEPDETKRDPLDFALWKKSKQNEPSWDSPWQRGRPGWHIECSVMSQKFLKTDTLDIHAGGRDLIFPHHENEIAQAEALTGKPFAKYWMHHGLLTINGQKMAKSLGNFITIKDFIAKYKYADILKLFFLSAHYAHPIDYTAQTMQDTTGALERILIFLQQVGRALSSPAAGASGGKRCTNARQEIPEVIQLRSKFFAAMDDDFSTPQALAAIFELINLSHKRIQDARFCLAAREAFLELSYILGLSFACTLQLDIGAQVEAEIEKRNAARQKGDFSQADRIRKDLEKKGIILEDGKEGTTWRRKL